MFCARSVALRAPEHFKDVKYVSETYRSATSERVFDCKSCSIIHWLPPLKEKFVPFAWLQWCNDSTATKTKIENMKGKPCQIEDRENEREAMQNMLSFQIEDREYEREAMQNMKFPWGDSCATGAQRGRLNDTSHISH